MFFAQRTHVKSDKVSAKESQKFAHTYNDSLFMHPKASIFSGANTFLQFLIELQPPFSGNFGSAAIYC